jgi:thioredoxin reductase (NADPH)
VGSVKAASANGITYRARSVILAMGAPPRYLDVPGERALLGRGVSSCATCDGFFFRDQDIAVIGGGDSAMEEATFLTRFARPVTVGPDQTGPSGTPPRLAMLNLGGHRPVLPSRR